MSTMITSFNYLSYDDGTLSRKRFFTKSAFSPFSFLLPRSFLSEYGFLFKLSTEINGYPATTPLLSGDNILSCFGFDEDLFDEDLLILAAIGAAGLVLAYGLLKRA